jgi:hypothetical protein
MLLAVTLLLIILIHCILSELYIENDLKFIGYSIQLSGNGNVIAITNSNNWGTYYIRVYERNGWTWKQRGDDIDGKYNIQDSSGSALSLNYDGNILAIGIKYGWQNDNPAGHARVLEWNTSHYVQRGNVLTGDLSEDFFGSSVSLSNDGNIIAIGAPNHNMHTGYVRVFEWNSTNWNKRGNRIDGESSFDRSGMSLSLSADGNVLAIGAPLNEGDSEYTIYTGQVRVYEWKYSLSSWIQRGRDLDGEGTEDRSGWSVSLSDNGNIIAIGAPYYHGEYQSYTDFTGHVRVFEWNETNWIQRGNGIDGQSWYENFGNSQLEFQIMMDGEWVISIIILEFVYFNGMEHLGFNVEKIFLVNILIII